MQSPSFRTAATALLLLAAASTPAGAATRIYTAPPANGGGPGTVVIAEWTVELAMGEFITGATFTSTFGNTVVPSSAIGTLSLAGITVASCDGPGYSCWEGPITPISYSFLANEFAALNGSIALIYDQTDCCDIRLGEQRLEIATDFATTRVPEPAAWAMFLTGFGLVGAAARRRYRPAVRLRLP